MMREHRRPGNQRSSSLRNSPIGGAEGYLRAMSQETVDLARRGYEALAAGDFERGLGVGDPDGGLEILTGRPDLPERLHGHAGFIENIRSLMEVFEDVRSWPRSSSRSGTTSCSSACTPPATAAPAGSGSRTGSRTCGRSATARRSA